MPFSLPGPVIDRLQRAQRVVVLTGGGLARECGVPTLREAHTGRWAEYALNDLATPQAFMRNPRLVWEFYEARRQATEAIQPSPAHYALVDLEQFFPHFTLITQMIDGLHWRSGSRELLEMNGCLRRSRCYEAGHVFSEWEDVGELPPRCPDCGSLMRPDVVMFGEGLPEWELRQARQAVAQCDLFLSVGSVAAIEPIATFPFLAKRAGAYLLSIDTEDSMYALMADHVIEAPACDVLPSMVVALRGEQERANDTASD